MARELGITIIIPTYNSEKCISRVLNGLFNKSTCIPRQTIIVDRCSKDYTIKLAKKYAVQVLSDSNASAAKARNLGLNYASEEIIAFIDSDCIPSHNWLEKIHKCFIENPEFVGVGGKMLPITPQNDIEFFSGNIFLNEIMKFPDNTFKPFNKYLPGSFITANCAYLKNALMEIGGFNEAFENHGEDIDLFWRMMDRFQNRLLYDPDIIVFHSFPGSYRKLIKKYIQYGIASSKLAKYHLKTPSIDPTIYKKLSNNFLKFLNPFNQNKKLNFLYMVQLFSHIFGKIYGSCKVRTINL